LNLEWVEPDFIGVGAGRRSLEDGYNAHALEGTRVPELFGAIQTAQGVKVAVLDTGIDLLHATLSSRLVEGFDVLTNTANP
jgi:serine protease